MTCVYGLRPYFSIRNIHHEQAINEQTFIHVIWSVFFRFRVRFLLIWSGSLLLCLSRYLFIREGCPFYLQIFIDSTAWLFHATDQINIIYIWRCVFFFLCLHKKRKQTHSNIIWMIIMDVNMFRLKSITLWYIQSNRPT